MKFGIIREGKIPIDKRAVFSPSELARFRDAYPQATFKVEPSEHRVFEDEEYANLGFEVTSDMSDCDVLLGVKEVPVEQLIEGKTYCFFSHTIKKQPHNQKLMKACIEKNITLIDHETMVDENGKRLIGFGRYAGIVGAYKTFRGFGLKYELYSLPKINRSHNQQKLIELLKKLILPPIKVVLTGKGKVGMGAREMLVGMKMKEVSVEQFLNMDFDVPVFVQIDVEDYYKRIDGSQGSRDDFKQYPELYESDFGKFSKVADIVIMGHFYKNGSPYILTREMLNDPLNQIKIVGDVTCDVGGPVACSLRVSTIEDSFYGYYPRTNEEVHVDHPAAVVVMAVDNLPCELSNDSTDGFGAVFLEKIVPAFFDGDKDNILERATICKNEKLMPRFQYLEDYAQK